MRWCVVLLAGTLVPGLVSDSLAQTDNGYVGIYGDSLGTTPCVTVPPWTGATLYVIAKTAGQSASGVTGVEFRIEVTNPTGWYVSYTPSQAASIAMGNPIDTDPDPNAGGGLNLSFPSCQAPSDSGLIGLGTVSVFNAGGGATALLVKRHSQPTNPSFACALFVVCDSPYYTKYCMTPAPPDTCSLGTEKAGFLASDPTVFTTTLNTGGGDSGGPGPSDPDREVLALFVPGVIELPAGQTHATLAGTTIHSPAVASVLESHAVESIAKAFPDFDPADAVAVSRTGETVRLQDLSEIYKLLLPPAGIPEDLAEDLAMLDEEVVYAEPGRRDGVLFASCPGDPYFGAQWYLQNTGAATPGQSTCTAGADIRYCDAHEITPGSSETIIAIMDTGVDENHPDLDGKVKSSSTDATGHGTHVAGIAAARAGNGRGIAGVSSSARIVSKPNEDAEALRQAAIVDTADVLNNSWGAVRFNQTLRGAFRDVYMLGRVVVASMGIGTTTWYPAAFGQGIIAVGATDCNDQHAEIGGTGDHIDVAAPGVDIWSTVPFSVDSLGYMYADGTSTAAPQVSGLAALLWAVDPGLYNDDIEQLIRLSADDVNRSVLPGFDEQLGMGRINAHRALQLLQPPHVLHHETASGGSAVDSTGWFTLRFLAPDSLYPAGLYRVRRFKVHRAVTFRATFDSIPHVWGRGVATIGYNPVDDSQGYNWNMGWCDTVGGTVTPSGCTLQTFVYEVRRSNNEPIGWWPARYDSVEFGYSVLGTTTGTDAANELAHNFEHVPKLQSANPLRTGATIAFSLPRAGRLRLEVFDVRGRRLRTLQDGELRQGNHELRWDGLTDTGRSIPAGIYVVRLKTRTGETTRKLVVLE